jgi:alpha-L-rhamnosidase
MLLNFSAEKTLEDWLFSVRNAQDTRGAIPGIVPTAGWGFAWGAGPNWDDALFECAYQIYRYLGDSKVIAENMDCMERYLSYMQTKKNEDGLFCYGLGDWCQPKSDYQPTTPTELTDSVKCIDICEKAMAMAKIVGRQSVFEKAQAMAKEIRQAFKKKYIQDGKCTVAEQTAVAYILYYGIAKECEESLQAQLLELIKASDEVFTTGVLGARVLFRVLADMGECDLAYKLIVQPKFPSYGYHVIRGARTLLERFFELEEDSLLPKNGCKQDSLNHHFWGDVSAWFISYVAGIKVNPDYTNVNSVEISPVFPTVLSFAEGKYAHQKGEIFSKWERGENGKILLTVRIPQGVTASLRLPKGYACETQTIKEGEQTLTVEDFA